MATDVKALIQDLAAELGFHRTVIGSLEPLDHERKHFEEWLSRGYAAGMEWLKRNPHFRTSPQLLFPSCRSAIIVSVSYFTETPAPPSRPFGRVARYAVGLDYHAVLRAKLRLLQARIEKEIGRPLSGKAFTDDVALYEQAFAKRHGLGFKGKNTMVIGPRLSGSYYFVAELFTDMELDADEPYQGTCGSCFRCAAKCPTNAIVEAGSVDAGRCISYLTIENKGGIPVEMRKLLGDWIFGCDICQEVCPYNQRPPHTPWEEFTPVKGTGHYIDIISLLEIRNEAEFRQRFGHTPVRRPKLRGLLRNALVVLGNQLSNNLDCSIDEERVCRVIKNAMQFHCDPMLLEHAVWALSQSKESMARKTAESLLGDGLEMPDNMEVPAVVDRSVLK